MKHLIIFIIFLLPISAFAQCNGDSQWPFNTLNAPNWSGDTLVVNNMWAGEYSIVEDFKPGETYIITTDSTQEDYITVTTEINNTIPGYQVIQNGVPPLNITMPGSGPYYVHVNLAVGCGEENSARKVTYVCTTCPEAANVGIGTEDPASSAILDIQSNNQGIRIPSMSTAQRDAIGDPVDGLIVYNTETKVIETYNDEISDWNSGGGQYNPFENSSIITVSQGEQINQWIGNTDQKWQRCYQKTVNGGTSNTFHTLCDNLGPTVTIIKLDNGRIFGGYNNRSWYGPHNNYLESQSTFIFSIDNNAKYHIGNSIQYSTLNTIGNGPTFGGGHDIIVNNAMNLEYVNFPHTYAYQGEIQSGSNQATMELAGLNLNTSATIVELEVWYQSF